MTIAERRAREAYDRAHPWRSIATAGPADIGMICEARFSFQGIATEIGRSRFFTDGNHWYRIDEPYRLSPWGLPMEFRSTGVRLSEKRMEAVISRSDEESRRPKRKRYELYWRAEDKNSA